MFDWLIADKLKEAYRKGKLKGYQEGWAEWANLASDTRYCENPHCMNIKSERRQDRREGHRSGYATACADLRSILHGGYHEVDPSILPHGYLDYVGTPVDEPCKCTLCQIVNEYKSHLAKVINSEMW